MTELKDIREGLAQLLNDQINIKGRITTNNPVIWQALHSITDDLWRELITDTLSDRAYIDAYETGLQILKHLDKYGPAYSPWCLTPYEGLVKKERRSKEAQAKGLIWRWCMTIRECYCRQTGIDLPNEDSSKGSLNLRPVDTLFDWNT